MHGFRPFGQGGPYPLPSNLSPLAPPFTVNPYFGRAGTNSLAGDPFYNNDPYFDQTYEIQLCPDTWPRPRSPTCLSDSFRNPNPNPVIDVNPGTTSIHPGSTAPASYDQFMSNFPAPQSVSRHFHPQFSSSRAATDRSTSLTANERGDVLPAMGSAPTAPVGVFWDAKSGTGQWKVGAPSYASFVSQGPGFSAVDNMQVFTEPSNVWVGKSADSVAEKSSVGSQHKNLPVGKLSSTFEENAKNAPFDLSKTSVLNPASRPENPYHQAPSLDFSLKPWNQIDPGLYTLNIKYVSDKTDPLGFYPTYPNSSTDQIYESPSINNPPTPINHVLSPNATPIGCPRDTWDPKEASACYISSSTDYMQVNAERSEVYSDTSSSNNGVEGSVRTRVDPSMLDASEMLEQFNPGVDSPCWKGASDSQYSLFGAAEAGLPHIPAEISVFNDFNLQGSQNHPPKSDNVVDVSSPKGRGKCFGKDGSSSFVKQSSPIVCSLPSSTYCGSHLEPSQTIKGSVASRQRSGEDKNADIGIGVKGAPLFGSSWVPNHGSDHSSSLPSSRSNVPVVDLNIPILLHGPFNNFTGSKFSRSQTVVNSMLVMSEMLLCYCTEDFGALKEQDHAVIHQVVQNLDACVLLTGTTSSAPKTQFLHSETANCSGKQADNYKGTEAGWSQASNTEVKDGQNLCKGKTNSSMFSTKKDNSLLLIVPAGDQELEQDDMTKGIQKILEENFHEDDEPDSQELLYKNLWLEAEAALCSLKYKERFARMKIGMQKNQNHTALGEPIDIEKLPSVEGTHEPKKDSLVESSIEGSEGSEESEDSVDSVDGEATKAVEQNLDQSTTTEDDNASVMARFRILKSRIDSTAPINKEGKPHDCGTDESLFSVGIQYPADISKMKQKTKVIDLGFAARNNPWPFIKGQHFMPYVSEQRDLVFGATMQSGPTGRTVSGECSGRSEFGAMQSAAAAAAATNILVDKFSTGECSSPSSEWEHVLKDAEWPA